MREILFRGKLDERIDEWIEGSIWHDSNSSTHIIGYRYWGEMSKDDLLDIDLISWKVIPETVGQYTGLTDKNGKKIFEGDIVRLTDEHNEMEWTAVVVFGNPNGDYSWGWQLNDIEEFDGNKDILLWVDMEESGAYCEIIGNIHDNPELLEGGA